MTLKESHIIIIIELPLLTTGYNYKRYILASNTHHSTLGMFRVTADGAAIVTIPIRRYTNLPWIGVHEFNLKCCSQ